MRPVEPERPGIAARSPPSRLLRDDTRFALGRIAVFQYLTVAIFLFLIAGFWILQIRDQRSQQRAGRAQPHQDRSAARAARKNSRSRRPRDRGQSVRLRADAYAGKSEAGAYRGHRRGFAPGSERHSRALVKRFASRSAKYVPMLIKQDLTPAELAFVESHRDSDTLSRNWS